MARKNTQNDDSDGTASQGSSGTARPSTTTSTGKRSPLMYVAIIGIVVVVIAIAYFELSGGQGGQSLSSKQIFSNVSSMNLNQTQALFVNDLEKSESVGNLYVSYYSSNATQYITQSGNLTIAISSNQTIDSYKLGNYNRHLDHEHNRLHEREERRGHGRERERHLLLQHEHDAYMLQ